MKKLLFGCLFFGYFFLSAQNFLSWQYYDRYFSVMVGSGKTAYFGELNYPGQLEKNFTHTTVGVEARLWSKISARVSAGLYQIGGKDSNAPDSSWRKQRNLSFDSKNIEFNLQGIYFFRGYNDTFFKRWRVDPYVALGIGTTYFNPYTALNKETHKLRPLQTEGISYNKFALTLPASAGVKLRINEFINFNIEIAYRYTLTDYLDDVSSKFPDSYKNTTQELLSNRKREIEVINRGAYDSLIPGQRRGNEKSNDQYLFLSLQLEIFLPSAGGPLYQDTSKY